jgi:tetratricopeptide (TPR) repeat protein
LISPIAKAGLIAALMLACINVAFGTPADDTKMAGKLYQEGRLDLALAAVNAALAVQPKDAQGRFLKGLILTEQKKTQDAVLTFTSLTEDFPELPEPYNNLAVLYAGQGNYDQARAALELAIFNHPTYAMAFENLGDIHAQLARRAYERALQLERSNTSAQNKLARVVDIFSHTSTIAATETNKSNPILPSEGAPKNVTAASSAAPDTVEQMMPGTSSDTAEDQVSATLNAWAKAWASKDIEGYLKHYSSVFDVPGGQKRATWEAQRKERIERAARISIDIKILKLSVSGSEATAIFRQAYRSEKTRSDNTKVIRFAKSGDRWLIVSESGRG